MFLHEQDVHAKQYRGYKEIELENDVLMRLPVDYLTDIRSLYIHHISSL